MRKREAIKRGFFYSFGNWLFRKLPLIILVVLYIVIALLEKYGLLENIKQLINP